MDKFKEFNKLKNIKVHFQVNYLLGSFDVIVDAYNYDFTDYDYYKSDVGACDGDCNDDSDANNDDCDYGDGDDYHNDDDDEDNGGR